MTTSLYTYSGKVASLSGAMFATSSGGGSSGAPLVVFTDFTDVPVGTAPSSTYIPSGLTAASYQGENSLGGYLTIYLTNPGTQANLGTAAGARVYIGGAEVANYRYLLPLNAATQAQTVGWPFAPIYALCVQVGSAGVQALTLGVAAALSVVVNGVSSNANDLQGNALTITPVQAPILFFDDINGNDSNSGLISSPVQHLQTSFSSGPQTINGIFATQYTVSGGKSSGVQAGTQAIGRGNLSSPSTWSVAAATGGVGGYLQAWRITGCAPTATPSGGLQGVNVGALKITSYPGPIAISAGGSPTGSGNAPETFYWIGPSGSSPTSFFFGQDSADATLTNPYGSAVSNGVGYSQYIHFSKLKVIPQSTNINAFMFNVDNKWDNGRIVDCEASQPTQTNATLAAGIAGDGSHNRIFGNWIHDIGGTTMNHGIYMDAEATFCWDWEVAYNFIYHCFGGSSCQSYAGGYGGTGPDVNGLTASQGLIVHHNCIDGKAGNTTNKFGVYWSDGTGGSDACVCAYNLLCNAGVANLGYNTEEQITVYNYNNTMYATNETYGLIYNEATPASGSTLIHQNNLMILGAGRSTSYVYWNNGAAGTFTFSNNQYFDPDGTDTSPGTGGTNEVYGDPLITTDWTNFSLTSSSPCIGTGTSSGLPVNYAYDYMLNLVPRSGQIVIQRGAFA